MSGCADGLSRLLAVVGVSVLLAACGTDENVARDQVNESSAQLVDAGLISASAQRPGDPERGRQALLTEPYVECGLPASVWHELGATDPAMSLEERGGRNAELPYFLTATTNDEGVDLVVNNCLTCHAAPLFGELVIGLGNEFADFTNNPSIAVERAGLLVRGDAETRAWEKYADRVASIAPYVQLPTVGSNPANNLTFALIAHRDPRTQAWSNTPLRAVPSTTPPPVSVPPWWRMRKKHAMFNMGEGRGDHARLMMSASMMCTDDRESLEAIDAYAPDIRAFISQLEAPPWPFAINQALARQGELLFNANCSACHGRYGADESYPNRLVDIDHVGTDATLVIQAEMQGKPWINWLNESYYGELSQAIPGRGYVAPPLDGIWATGPYLHNGSVPNLYQVLDSSQRPALWMSLARSGNDVDAFDREHVGWLHQTLTVGSLEALDSDRHKYVYDTAKVGHGNGGHTFGDHLEHRQRLAVIEYLKTL